MGIFWDAKEEKEEIINDPGCEDDDENISSGQIFEILLNTREQGQMMESLIKNQIEVKDELINKLHSELDFYKQEAADRFVNQVMKALIKVRKDMGKCIFSDDFNSMSAQDMQREYKYIFEDLTDLLEQQNIDSYTSAPGDDFDASIHQPKMEITDLFSLDKKIKESISEGYKKGDKVIIPERVVVYKFKEQ